MTTFAQIQAAQTPGLNDVLDAACSRVASQLRVCLPAKVDRVLGQQRVDVKPLLKQRVRGLVLEYPIVPAALVCMPVGAGFELSYRLQPGDTGILLCADRSLDAYAAGDGATPVDPADSRCHHLTDAIFVPGLVPTAKQTATTDDMVLRNGAATMHLQKNGTFTFRNQQNEMMALLVQMAQQLKALADDLASAQVLTPLGPSPFLSSSIANFVDVSGTMADVASRLQTLQGD